MNTLVSAFVSSVNSRYENSINHYYELGKLLLLSSIPKIIFVDEPMFNLIDNNYDKNVTYIIKINKTDSYLYDYINIQKIHLILCLQCAIKQNGLKKQLK